MLIMDMNIKAWRSVIKICCEPYNCNSFVEEKIDNIGKSWEKDFFLYCHYSKIIDSYNLKLEIKEQKAIQSLFGDSIPTDIFIMYLFFKEAMNSIWKYKFELNKKRPTFTYNFQAIDKAIKDSENDKDLIKILDNLSKM